jgi:DNA-binding NarL/FixJ family response regulator
MVRILIADEHPIVRRGIRGIIERHADWAICGEAADGRLALDLALQERPDVVVSAVELPLLDGVIFTSRLKAALLETEVLIFTVRDDERTITAALAAGARGYLLKSEAVLHLVPAISALSSHRPFFSPTVSDLLLEATMIRKGRTAIQSFTPRELEIVQFVCDGVPNTQIAERLGLSVKTVETHRGSALRKAGARSASDLVRFAMKNRLIAA